VSIRKYKKTEVNKLIKIWYEGSVIAHDFIEKDFWKSQLIIAGELSHLCGILSQSMRSKEPPFAERRTTLIRIKKSLLYNNVACKQA